MKVRGLTALVMCFALLGMGAAGGQEDDDDLDLLDQMLVDMQDQSRSELEDRVRALEIENGELRERNLSLERELEEADIPGLRSALGELVAENVDLRDTVQALSAQITQAENLAAEMADAARRAESELAARPVPVEEEPEPEPVVVQQVPKPDVAFRIVKEWGRSPEVTETMSGNVSSLKGMAMYVSPGLSDRDMESLARYLRAEYAVYDNVNIEVFDDETAAREFADSGRTRPLHRVLSVSKHQKSGRDMMLLFRGGQARELR